ncbi:GNAT family N-acetyltransferase [Acinetobacter sp. P1(2025)]|uniref:GNAT family N-acetyltransferase n=1 Tax=Acinetobacter sp. P1(2025) TaxID=3446120 RepID=UPI003F52CDA9
MIIIDPIASQSENDFIYQWLDARFYNSLGITFFLERTKDNHAKWELLRVYDLDVSDLLLGIAIISIEGTCFWLPDERDVNRLLCSTLLERRPKRIVTNTIGHDLLHRFIGEWGHITREYDQWIMVCSKHVPKATGRLALVSDIDQLVEYQALYNQERAVKETPDWMLLIKQRKIAVYEVDGKIVSIIRFGIETNRLVSIGGTYTFPSYRRQGFAQCVLAFVVNHIVDHGRIAHLIVDKENNPAVELYNKMGFEYVGSSYTVYPDYL